jgi:hypothetical protein
LPLTLQGNHPETPARSGDRPPWKWAAALAVLALLSICLRYGEALVGKRALARRVAHVRLQAQALPPVDRDLSFLQFLETNQPPFLDALNQLAQAAPPGARVDSLAISRRGDLTLRGTVSSAPQALAFRSKLVDGGYFASVVLDEQTPAPDRQKLAFRLTAQLRPAAERPVPTEPPAGADRSNAPPPVDGSRRADAAQLSRGVPEGPALLSKPQVQ